MTTKHTLPALYAACTALCLAVLPLSADTFGKFTYTDDGTSITTTGYPASTAGALDIPAAIAGKPLTSIGNRAFAFCSQQTFVTIPASVTSIGESAFEGCSGLTGVTIPSGITRIGELCVLGNAPVFMGQSVFDSSASGFTINYITGKTGFTSPTWLGYPCVGLAATPEIDVQQPLGTSLVNGTAKKSFKTVVVGQSGTARIFTLKNTGMNDLTNLVVNKDGVNAGNFMITPPAKTTLVPGETTTFKVTFKPTASGIRSAAIHIQSNDANENTFDIHLTGTGAP